MIESQERTIDLLGHSVTYDVTYSSEATKPRLDVDIRGVTVTLPESDGRDPEELLHENAAWVIEKKREFDAHRAKVPERRYEEGATFPYLGEDHEVVVEQRPSSSVVDGTFRLASHHVQQTSVKRALETLYRRKARQRFERRVDALASEMGVEYDRIEIRNQRTKWGSCSTTGTLGLNWRLMMAPKRIIDYVIVHELAHLREPDHSPAFWELVSEYDPEYESHAQWLTENSARLVFSEDDY